MTTYLFETTATMKVYNCKKWYIDPEIIGNKIIKAETLKDALKEYQKKVYDQNYITISNNALKYKSPMYLDTKDGETKQVGYVITGKTEFEDRDNYKWSAQYIDLWVTISIISIPNFE